MSERSGFGSGFLLGAIFGGVVGGVAGAIAASRVTTQKPLPNNPEEEEWLDGDEPIQFDSEENMELARRRLESKIAQLNGAIDDVRQQMSVIHPSHSQENSNS